MPLVFGAIAPHGGDAIAEIADNPAVMAKTRAGLEELGRRFAAARPDTVVVLNPHGPMIRGAVSVGVANAAVGELEGKSGQKITLALRTDRELIEIIADEAGSPQVPYAVPLPLTEMPTKDIKVSGRASEPVIQCDWLDWGALVPLWFLARPLTPQPRVVLLAPDRRLPREILVRVGVAIARAAAKTDTRVALVASCDQGHAHAADGPYGYDPASAEHDRAMCEVIAENNLPALLDWSQSFLETAKVDAFWQTIMLAGALGHTPMHGELLSYEAPTYFGMAVAAYTPV